MSSHLEDVNVLAISSTMLNPLWMWICSKFAVIQAAWCCDLLLALKHTYSISKVHKLHPGQYVHVDRWDWTAVTIGQGPVSMVISLTLLTAVSGCCNLCGCLSLSTVLCKLTANAFLLSKSMKQAARWEESAQPCSITTTWSFLVCSAAGIQAPHKAICTACVCSLSIRKCCKGKTRI